jgi:hypothetical protein
MDGFSIHGKGDWEVPPSGLPPDADHKFVDPEIGVGYDEEEVERELPYDETPTGFIGTGEDLGVDETDGDTSDDMPSDSVAEASDEPVSTDVGRTQVTEYRGETGVTADGFPRTDLYDRIHRLGLPADEVVLVGSGAVEAVVGPEQRRAADLDLAVSEGLYRHLREQPGITEEFWPGGDPRLKGDGIDVSLGWAGKSVDELRAGGYTNEGVQVAGLPDVYRYKQDRGDPKDERDLQIVRNRLYGDRPLPLGVLKGETEFLEGFMPEHLHGHPALHVAANGLYVVKTVFGVEGESVRTYNGSVEQGVPATFHAWGHSAYGTRDGQRSMDIANTEAAAAGQPEPFDDRTRLAHAVGYANHDVILGHGRQAANPLAHDELQSADMAVRHLEAVGVADGETLEETHAVTMSTTYSEARRAQDIDPDRGYVPAQEIGAGSDMAPFRRTDAPRNAARLVPEDLSRVGAGYDEPLTRLTNQLNANLEPGQTPVRVRSAEDGMRLVDQHPDFPVTKTNADGTTETMTLREAACRHLEGSAGFIENYQFPSSWRLGSRDTQVANGAVTRTVAARVRSGEISAVEALQVLDTYAQTGSL